MAKFTIQHFNPHHVEPQVYIIEAHRMEVRDGSVVFFRKWNNSTPSPPSQHLTA